ncbi:dihydropteroate synthase [Chlamydiota bacterium]
MILIGERINAGFKDIKEAVLTKNASSIKEWAKKQEASGANYLDINLGTVSQSTADLCWMIENVQEAVSIPVSIDNNKPAMLKEAIKVCEKPPLINSIIADDSVIDEIIPIVIENNASVIGLAMDENGSPTTSEKRVEHAGKIFMKTSEYGLPPEQLFLDPIVMPVKHMQIQVKAVLDAVKQFQLFSDPPCHIVCGLSNIGNGTVHKKLINRIFVATMISYGLDAAIMDVCDKELVESILTAELLMNKSIYADMYIESFYKTKAKNLVSSAS